MPSYVFLRVQFLIIRFNNSYIIRLRNIFNLFILLLTIVLLFFWWIIFINNSQFLVILISKFINIFLFFNWLIRVNFVVIFMNSLQLFVLSSRIFWNLFALYRVFICWTVREQIISFLYYFITVSPFENFSLFFMF